MTYNLFDITYRTAREANILYAGTCTGGSTTTIGDTTLSRFEDDYFNKVDKGTAWITWDAGGTGVAPQGEYTQITDFVSSTGVVTTDAVSTAVAAGDKYALATDEFPIDQIIGSVNMAMQDMGTIPITNSTAVTIASAQTEYTLPDMSGGELLEVWYQGKTTDANDNRWGLMPKSWWEVEQAAIGTADTIRFTYQLSSTHACMLVYDAPHTLLVSSTHQLSEHVPLQRVVYPAALNLLRWKKQDLETERYDDQIIKLEVKSEQAMRANKIMKPRRKNKAWTFKSETMIPDDEVGTVHLY
jgi:hypothetical protein